MAASATSGASTSAADLAGVAQAMADAQKTSMQLAILTTQNETQKAMSQAVMDSHKGLAR
jgi:hypothetical protein